MQIGRKVAADDLKFLRKIQRLLSKGEFVATYKFALLQALADLSVESTLVPGLDRNRKIALTDATPHGAVIGL
ncbi:MAG: hypothetical protein DRR42_21125 [Gammaproteobacteria bacterium]|nr:MAG: hypothetical protein DRR42_21125 [Gammaproteobacteria bacterium]